MFYRQCKKCGCAMDPGEGRGGVCDDCIKEEQERMDKHCGWRASIHNIPFPYCDYAMAAGGGKNEG